MSAFAAHSNKFSYIELSIDILVIIQTDSSLTYRLTEGSWLAIISDNDWIPPSHMNWIHASSVSSLILNLKFLSYYSLSLAVWGTSEIEPDSPLMTILSSICITFCGKPLSVLIYSTWFWFIPTLATLLRAMSSCLLSLRMLSAIYLYLLNN
jgi:hypothetical protein